MEDVMHEIKMQKQYLQQQSAKKSTQQAHYINKNKSRNHQNRQQ